MSWSGQVFFAQLDRVNQWSGLRKITYMGKTGAVAEPQSKASFEGAGGRRPSPKEKEKRKKERKKEKKKKKMEERKKGAMNNVKLLHIKYCFSNFLIARWH